jgi:endoglucanase
MLNAGLKRYFLLAAAAAWLLFYKAMHKQGFLKADGKKIVDEKGKNVLLRGMGLGGWMLQEGYMLHVNKDSRQYRIRERLEELMGACRNQGVLRYLAGQQYPQNRCGLDEALGF